jgi:hypothetical protein
MRERAVPVYFRFSGTKVVAGVELLLAWGVWHMLQSLRTP